MSVMGIRLLGTVFLLLLAFAVTEAAAQDIVISKSFTDDPAPPGETVTLEFTIENPSDSFDVTDAVHGDDGEEGSPLPR